MPKVTWAKVDVLEDGSFISVPKSTQGLSVRANLSISLIYPEDSGTYICFATNKYGTVTQRVNVKVISDSSKDIVE